MTKKRKSNTNESSGTTAPKTCFEKTKSSKQKSSLTAKKSKIGTWNLQCGTRIENLAEYAKWCLEMGIPILAVQETKRKTDNEAEEWYFPGELLEGWKFMGTGTSEKVGGVGFILGPGVKNVEIIEHAK